MSASLEVFHEICRNGDKSDFHLGLGQSTMTKHKFSHEQTCMSFPMETVHILSSDGAVENNGQSSWGPKHRK